MLSLRHSHFLAFLTLGTHRKPSSFHLFDHEYRELWKEVKLSEGKKWESDGYFHSSVRNRTELQRKIAKGRRLATFSLACLSYWGKKKRIFIMRMLPFGAK